MKKLAPAAVLTLVFAAGILGYLHWEREQARLQQDAVLRLLTGATRALREGMTPGRDAATQSRALHAAAERVDQDLAMLREASTERVQALATDAADYLVTVRELLKRRTVIVTLDGRVRDGMAAFRRHMLTRREAPDWTHHAVRLNNQLEEDFREYQRTVASHTRLSDDYAQTHARLEPVVPAQYLVPPEEVSVLRDRTAARGEVASTEMQSLRQLKAPAS